jgi:tetratricopeptide (TPR) repeat protein
MRLLVVVLFTALILSCTSTAATSAEEYYAIGMAYFDMGKYPEAKKWLDKARVIDKTKIASEYNLGRIEYETGHYADAYNHFDVVLKQDPDNVMALKAAAYTKIKLGDTEGARALYSRVLKLVPESADDGYNYALVLFKLEQYDQAEAVLTHNRFALQDNKDVLLLYARTLGAQDKPEAVDQYAAWLETNTDVAVRFEYARVLEKAAFYVRALEQYRDVLKALPDGSTDPTKATVRFAVARVLLIADPENAEGITELRAAVTDGLVMAEVETLLDVPGISAVSKEAIRRIIAGIVEPEVIDTVIDTTEIKS